MDKKTEKSPITTAGGRLQSQQVAKKRVLAAEEQRALEMGFLALAKEVAQDNAETLRLLAKH
jgi:hypothetical protein